jgi:hypothetical protein
MKMLWPTQPMINEVVDKELSEILVRATHRAMRDRMVKDEAFLRRLLEHWVSECEPAAAIDANVNLAGLCDAAAEVGYKVPILNPFK